MTSNRALEAAKAVNSILFLSARDQESPVDVLEDYFTTPGEKQDDSDNDGSDLDDSEKELQFNATQGT